MKGGKVPSKRRIRRAPYSGEPVTHIIIGNRLRHYYKDILEQPVPQRFTKLLNQLEGKLADEKPR